MKAFLDESNIDTLVNAHDVVVDCSDNMTTRQLLNQICFRYKKPLVSGAAIRFEGQVSTFCWLQDEPCYQCFSQFFSNQGASSDDSCVMSGVIAPIVGVVGSVQALEVLKLITRAGNPLSQQMLMIDGLTGQFRSMKVKKDPACPVCGVLHK